MNPSRRKHLADMSPQEGSAYLLDLKKRLARKQARERGYLDRRARRSVHTPTDDAYEADQELENELISLLEEVIGRLADEHGEVLP